MRRALHRADGAEARREQICIAHRVASSAGSSLAKCKSRKRLDAILELDFGQLPNEFQCAVMSDR